MVYIGILVAVAALGLLRLWLQQRRQRRNVAVGSVKETLERVSARPPVTAAVHEGVGTSDPARRRRAAEPGRRSVQQRRQPMRSQPSRRREPLDQERREAARRRIKERRAARSRAVG